MKLKATLKLRWTTKEQEKTESLNLLHRTNPRLQLRVKSKPEQFRFHPLIEYTKTLISSHPIWKMWFLCCGIWMKVKTPIGIKTWMWIKIWKRWNIFELKESSESITLLSGGDVPMFFTYCDSLFSSYINTRCIWIFVVPIFKGLLS